MSIFHSHRTHLLAALLIALVLFSAVPADAAPSKVERLSTELENVRDDLKSAGRAFDKAYWELHESEVRLDSVNAEISKTEEELAHAQGLLSDRIELMYRSDTSGYMNVLLGSLTFEEMVTRLDFFQRIGQADADAIASVKDLRTQLNEQRTSLEQETASQATALAGLKARRDDLQGRFSTKQAEYDRVKKELDAARAAAGASSTGGSTAAVAGPNGMIFPVQGVNYYSDTWGASRSGGRRRHKGTDIKARAGTPCVAVLSGTVSSKSGGLGGKTIWLTSDNGWQFYYAHLDGWAVRSGRVRAGQVIGYVGSTGNASASAPHLHFEIHPGGGAAVNPYPYLRRMQ